MPPKKKARKDSVTKKNTSATTIAALTPLHHACLKSIEAWYALRHNTETDCTVMRAAPILFGGHFKGIAQRAWDDPAGLINKCLELCKHCGLVDEDCSVNDFGSEYLRLALKNSALFGL